MTKIQWIDQSYRWNVAYELSQCLQIVGVIRISLFEAPTTLTTSCTWLLPTRKYHAVSAERWCLRANSNQSVSDMTISLEKNTFFKCIWYTQITEIKYFCWMICKLFPIIDWNGVIGPRVIDWNIIWQTDNLHVFFMTIPLQIVFSYAYTMWKL